MHVASTFLTSYALTFLFQHLLILIILFIFWLLLHVFFINILPVFDIINIISLVMGIGFALINVKLLKIPSFLPSRFLSTKHVWLKYIVQIVLITLSFQNANKVMFSEKDEIPIGVEQSILFFIGVFFIVYYWNGNDDDMGIIWKKDTKKYHYAHLAWGVTTIIYAIIFLLTSSNHVSLLVILLVSLIAYFFVYKFFTF